MSELLDKELAAQQSQLKDYLLKARYNPDRFSTVLELFGVTSDGQIYARPATRVKWPRAEGLNTSIPLEVLMKSSDVQKALKTIFQDSPGEQIRDQHMAKLRDLSVRVARALDLPGAHAPSKEPAAPPEFKLPDFLPSFRTKEAALLAIVNGALSGDKPQGLSKELIVDILKTINPKQISRERVAEISAMGLRNMLLTEELKPLNSDYFRNELVRLDQETKLTP